MNKDKQNLLAIMESIERIEEYLSPFSSADDLFDNAINFDAAMMNFIIIGEMVDRLTDQFKKQYKHIDWVQIKGFRNIIAHDYFGIDAEEVWQIATTHLIELKNDVDEILDEME